MKLKLFMPTTSIAGGLFMLKRTNKKVALSDDLLFTDNIVSHMRLPLCAIMCHL